MRKLKLIVLIHSIFVSEHRTLLPMMWGAHCHSSWKLSEGSEHWGVSTELGPRQHRLERESSQPQGRLRGHE